jgi:hypothetical protein
MRPVFARSEPHDTGWRDTVLNTKVGSNLWA